MNQKVDKDELREIVKYRLEGMLSNLYIKYQVKTGDISVEQIEVWNKCVEKVTDLFSVLIEQNMENEEKEKTFTKDDMLKFGEYIRSVSREDVVTTFHNMCCNMIFGGSTKEVQYSDISDLFKNWKNKD